MKQLITIISLIILSSTIAFAELHDFYADFSNFLGIDPNAGQNSFLTLIIPAGGRYESMGTAYSAVTIDSSFLDANPASSVFLETSELSFHHNDWISDSNIESIVYTQRYDKLGWGVGGKLLWLPFDSTNSWGATTGQGAYTETILTGNIAYNFFSDYYYNGLAIGANVKFGYRGVSSSIAENQSGLAIMGDIGLVSRFNLLKFYKSREKNFALAVVVKNLGWELVSDPDPLPTIMTAGLSYTPWKPITISFDFNVPFNLDGSDSELPFMAAGLNVNFTSFLSMQGGFLIKTGKPRFSIGAALELKWFDIMINYLMDLTTQYKNLNGFSITLNLNLGDMGRANTRDQVQELYLEGLEEYANGNLLAAIAIWEQCLEKDPDFTPAKEMIETSRKTLELEEEMRDRQTIE